MTLPGRPVGAGRALTVGEKELAPPGPTDFSVGAGAAGALELGEEGASVGLSLVGVLQAVSAPIPTMATPPAASASCLVKRAEIIASVPCFLGPFIRAKLVNYTSLPGVSACRTGDDYRRSRRADREEARAAAPQTGQNAITGDNPFAVLTQRGLPRTARQLGRCALQC